MGTNKSVTAGQHTFAQIPRAEIQRSVFNRSCGVKTTFDAGWLIPIFADEALPGDTMSMKMTHFGRFATPLHPIMDNVYVDTFFFAIPYRLVWENWEKFNGEQTNPGDSTSFLTPVMDTTGVAVGFDSLSDYLGIPPTPLDLEFTSLFHRAYNLVYNEWFRDENLIDSAVVDTDDGPDNLADYVLRRRGKRHDYFTSCLPWPQKGPAVSLPLGTTAPVTGIAAAGPTFDVGASTDLALRSQVAGGNVITSASPAAESNLIWNQTNLEADLSTATAATINNLREAFQIQRLYERDARGGTRYTEVVRSHFGVVSPDQRLQRPEYLGGGSGPLSMAVVPQTSSTDVTSPQANLAAYGTVAGSNGFTKSFTEHCLILGLVNLRADLNYQYGLNRMFSRRSRWDFYWPALAHLGEQAVLAKELFATGSGGGGADDLVFGYQERFAEYRYKPSVTSGRFRSIHPQSLDTWHLAEDWASPPLLNQTFIEVDPPVDRVIAVDTEPHVLFDAYFDYKCARPMPTYSVPGLIDHF